MALAFDRDPQCGFDVLDEDECRWLLDRTYIGRVAVTIGALPSIFTVNYAVRDGAIYFLTGRGTKLAAALRGAAVAFQADQVDFASHTGWSVQAIGMAEEVHELEASELLPVLDLNPWAPGERNHLVRIQPEFFSGRRIGWPHPRQKPWAPDAEA